MIEVKAFGLSACGNDLWLETRQVDEARTNGRFHLYVVDNVRQGNPAASGGPRALGASWSATQPQRDDLERAQVDPYALAFPVAQRRAVQWLLEKVRLPHVLDNGREVQDRAGSGTSRLVEPQDDVAAAVVGELDGLQDNPALGPHERLDDVAAPDVALGEVERIPVLDGVPDVGADDK